MQIVTGDDKVLQKCWAIGLTCGAVSSKGEISDEPVQVAFAVTDEEKKRSSRVVVKFQTNWRFIDDA